MTSASHQEQPSRYYFHAAMIGYNFGLIGSAVALFHTKKPQPALLYICPVMVIVYLCAAFLKHETLQMLCYDEDEELSKFEIKTQKAQQ